RPANRFVADFIGTTNLLDGTVVDGSTVCLANGTRVAARCEHPAGTTVAVCLRPERARVVTAGDGTASRIDGVIDTVTYIGNARVYTVRLDWMQLRVREENRPGAAPREAGDPVSVTWDMNAVTVVTE
ncbi:MAG: TOBE domain-containing protein, partial [Ilumatobacteraceae bacterium]